MKQVNVILFMMIITAIFIGSLAIVNEATKSTVEQNVKVQEMKSILYAFGMLPDDMDENIFSSKTTTGDLPWVEEDVLSTIENEFEQVNLFLTNKDQALLNNSFLTVDDSIQIYIQKNQNNVPVAYGFHMRGKGLWGTISAFGVMDTSLTSMRGIDFTEQVETPGLGARITEQEFKYFFRGLDISDLTVSNQQATDIQMVREKRVSNLESSENTLQAITGATQTCNGVVNMLNIDLRFYKSILQKNRDAIFKQIKG